ncbi:MAG: RNA polymerase sigma factor [Capsulimonadales bacterium]|nr:RNA polymerase sigma factor [Capsulimonadales bacterium]
MHRVPHSERFALDPLRLAAERGRIVRLCARQVHSAEVAEDLAQETLAIAWRQRHSLKNGDVWQAWLNGIARNVCLRYLRKAGVERERLVTASGDNPATDYEMLVDASVPDLSELLDRDDISRLLDRALDRLPSVAQDLLVDRYIRELPIEEIAARRGVREATAVVQLHRSRQALRRVLTHSEMRTETVALGLIDEGSLLWQETRLWCPDCGMHRLEGFLGFKSPSEGAERNRQLTFSLRCPGCSRHEGAFLFMGHCSELLDGVKGFKPALNRVNRWWSEHTARLIRERSARCLRCGHFPVPVFTVAPESFPWSFYHGRNGLFTECERCRSATAIEIHEIARHLPAAQRFWQSTPRLRTLEPFRVESADGPLLVTRLESVTDSRSLEIALHPETLETVRIVST